MEDLGCRRNVLESYNPHARELHWMRITCMGIARDVHMPCAWDVHMGSSMSRDSPIFLGMFFTTRN